MASTAELSILIQAKDEASKVFKDVDQHASGLGKTLGDVSKIAGGFVIGAALTKLPGLFTSVLDASSNMHESVTKAQTVFGDSFGQIEKFASGAATSMGMTKQAALEASGTFGNFLQSMGQTQPEAAKMSQAMVKLAADLGSFNNANPEEVLLALRSGLSGEAEPMRKFGVALSETAVKAKLLEMNIKPVGKEFTEQQKIMARYQIIMDQTKMAQGDFAATSDGAANSMKILGAMVGNAKVAIGDLLLPAIMQGAKLVQEFARFFIAGFEDVDKQGEKLALTSKGLVGAFVEIGRTARSLYDTLGPIVKQLAGEVLAGWTQIGQFLTSHKEMLIAVGVAFGALVVSMLAVPLAIAAVVAGVGLLVAKWDELTAKFPIITQALDTLKTAFGTAATFAQEKWTAFVAYWNTQLGPAMENVKTAITAALTYIKDLFAKHLPEMANIVKAQIAVIKAQFELIKDIVGGVIKVVVDLINGDWDKAWKDAKELASNAVKDLKRAIGAEIDLIVAIFKGLGALILPALADLVTLLFNEGSKLGKSLANGVLDGLKSLPGDVASKLKGLAGGVTGAVGGFLGRASGGPVSGGSPYIVGERGPELFVPGSNGTIVPNGGGGHVTNINVYVSGDVHSDQGILRVLRDAMAGGGFYGVVNS